MPDEPPDIVPFGKYRGQPVDVLAADRSYLDWLRLQPGATERWPWLLVLVAPAVPRMVEDTPTPEHNRLQAKFLDPKICRATVSLTGNLVDNEKEEIKATFEAFSLDVIIITSRFWAALAWLELKPIMGDDFPAVLRKFKQKTGCLNARHFPENKRFDIPISRAIIVEYFAADGLTFEQARAMCEVGGIKLFLMSEIEAERDRLFA